jgi:hypothetical protein
MDMVGISDVLCRYSLGTNPRGVKEYLFFQYTLVTILMWLDFFGLLDCLGWTALDCWMASLYNIVVVCLLHMHAW